jgi:hypothetical protein
MPKNIPTLSQYAWKYFNTQPKCPSQSTGLNFHGLESNTRPKYIDFTSFFLIYGLGLFHIGPEDIGLTMFAKHLS